MTLKQLEAFYWAATCRNFSIAAERVNLSPSSLSKRLAELENSLGVQLFARSGRSADLTPSGAQLLPRIRELLRSAAELQQTATHGQGLHGRCRIGVGELSGLTWLPKLVHEVTKRHPDLQLEPYVDIGEVLEQRIEDGELDCAVIAGAPSSTRLASEWVAEARFVWAASPALIVLAGTDALQRLMQEQTLICLPQGAGGTRLLEQWLARHSKTIQSRLTCNNWGAVVGMVIEGLGYTFMPKAWAEALQARQALQVLQRGGSLAPLSYSVQWRVDDTRPMITEIRDIIRSVIDFPAPRSLT